METGQITTVSPRLLIANDAVALVTRFVKIKGGQGPLMQGTLLDKEGQALESGGDVFSILAQNVNTGASGSSAPVAATIYLHGAFIRQRVFFKNGNAIDAETEKKMRELGMIVLETAN